MNWFAKNLRYLRKKGNYNQDEIAALFNKRANTVGNWENQKSEPNLTELIKLTEFFQVNTHHLLTTDIESATKDPAFAQSYNNIYTHVDSPGNASSQSNQTEIGVIMNELKTLQEKMDFLNSGMQSGFWKTNSDKSYH